MKKVIIRSSIFGWVIALTVVALSGPNAATAETVVFAAGPAYGGSGPADSGFVTCRVFNFGTPATISSRRIFANTNVAVPLFSDTCNVPLGTRKYCQFTHNISANLAFTCQIAVTANNVKISGGIDIADIVNNEVVITVSAPFQR
jgi:hypothetical protein